MRRENGIIEEEEDKQDSEEKKQQKVCDILLTAIVLGRNFCDCCLL
jgi:hypothetical protein